MFFFEFPKFINALCNSGKSVVKVIFVNHFGKTFQFFITARKHSFDLQIVT